MWKERLNHKLINLTNWVLLSSYYYLQSEIVESHFSQPMRTSLPENSVLSSHAELYQEKTSVPAGKHGGSLFMVWAPESEQLNVRALQGLNGKMIQKQEVSRRRHYSIELFVLEEWTRTPLTGVWSQKIESTVVQPNVKRRFHHCGPHP